jgi:small subunit ribosomal protein S8
MTDPITDMLNRIRNGQAVGRPTVNINFSNLKYELAKILEKEGFIKGVEKKGRMKRRIIKITLKYTNKTPNISGMKRVSKPGQRVYLPSKKIKKVKGGLGILIISTSKGLMTNKEAKRQKLGGEVLCEIW